MLGANELPFLPGKSLPQTASGARAGRAQVAHKDTELRGFPWRHLPAAPAGAARRRTDGCPSIRRVRSGHQNLLWTRPQGFSECCIGLLPKVVAFFCPMQGSCQLSVVPVCLHETRKCMIMQRKGRMSRAIIRTRNSGINAWTFVHNVNILRCSVEGDRRFALNSIQSSGRRSCAPFRSAVSADPIFLFFCRCARFIRHRAARVGAHVPLLIPNSISD